MADSDVADDWEIEADDEVEQKANPSSTSGAPVVPSTGVIATDSAANEDGPHVSQSHSAISAITDGAEVGVESAESEEQDRTVLDVYRHIPSRRVDLVGDYAGNELFVIDGDSLLLRAFEDEQLDFDHGFQLLHAVYIVEHFIKALVQRNCNFHVVFVEANRDLSIPSSVTDERASKYRLARSIVRRHLVEHVPKYHPQIAVHTFTSHDCPELTEYLRQTEPYFLMLHDGSRPSNTSSKAIRQLLTGAGEDENKDGPGSFAQREVLRSNILNLMYRGYNVALINGLQWKDTKVMTVVLEQSRRRLSKSWPLPVPESQHVIPAVDVGSALKTITQGPHQFTQRELLAILTVHAILVTDQEKTRERSQECCRFLAHLATIVNVSLGSRRVHLSESTKTGRMDKFVHTLASVSDAIVSSPGWLGHTFTAANTCDLADYVDGRLLTRMDSDKFEMDQSTIDTFTQMLNGVQLLVDTKIEHDYRALADSGAASEVETTRDMEGLGTVLPFSNPVFDKHLEIVHLTIDDDIAAEPSPIAAKLFRELSHWHNAKRPITKGAPIAMSKKDQFWADRRNQWFMAEMRTYAASLTNAVGKSLNPETIIEGSKSAVASNAKKNLTPKDDINGEGVSKSKSAKSGGGKNAAKAAEKEAMLKSIASDRAKKNDAANNKIINSWHTVCNNLESDKDPRSRYRWIKNYLVNLQPATSDVVGAEIELYLVNQLILYWISLCRDQRQESQQEVLALIWHCACNVFKNANATKTVLEAAKLTATTLQLPPLPEAAAKKPGDRKLAFDFALPTNAPIISNSLPPKEFQLLYCGPYLERSFDSRPDDRVDFQPDGWQRNVLDALDKDESVFVVAPTSAGKTFISFYAMKKVLEADSEGVIVYVAPTKALVNQIAAEIQARYSKSYKFGGKSVWAIHTRDYRINNPTGCQVLVTVPHVLQIMLLAPSNANGWSSRIRRIIFDEVHSIGQAEDGVVWEQLLLLAPCPIVALSATVGNPEEFSGWLGSTQAAIGQKLVTVEHQHRYSDLRKYLYSPSRTFSFSGLPDDSAFGTLSLDGVPDLNFIHPVGGLTDKSRGVPRDLSLEPRDCFLLWKAMVKHEKKGFTVPENLDPNRALPDIARKVDILGWETGLKTVLCEWIARSDSPYDRLVSDLGASFLVSTNDSPQKSDEGAGVIRNVDEHEVTSSALPLLCRLHAQGALPAILFNFDRHACEDLCKSILQELQDSEEANVKSGKKWENTLERWEEWKKIQAKNAAKKPKVATKKGNKADDEERESKLDLQRDAGAQESSRWESFDPKSPQPGYHFADHSKVLASDLEVFIKQLGRRQVPQYLIDGLTRGIGVHHAGMNRKYRQVVEILFRKRFLRVVIATGTLALGINMPAKTVVFSGDSVFLTALNFRQCAGRAGRRGFDLLGNVVFQGVSHSKIRRLLSSRLPDLNGHFPITTTLVLRMFTLLHESKQSKYAVNAINALLSQPRLFLGGPAFKEATMHHLRFSIEYLRRQHLLDSRGASLNFAGLVSHLYFTERSAFAFHALIKAGYFHELCADVHKAERSTLETLMLVMAHIFGRQHCRQSDEEYREKIVKPSSSIVFLPPLPEKAAVALRDHNQQTLEVYRTYVATFVNQHVKHEDDKLPATGLSFARKSPNAALSHGLPPVKIRSSFAALSGLGDEFSTIHDLCRNVREGVFLEEDVIPYIPVQSEAAGESPLNAWLLDFYKHGDVHTLEKANGIRRSDIWFMLNDFSLVLATIITSLMNYMKLSEGTDLDMLDVKGDFDTHEEERDDQVAADEFGSEISGPSAADSGIVINDVDSFKKKSMPLVGKKSGKKVESWEDTADAETAADHREKQRQMLIESQEQADRIAAAANLKDEGLRDVLLAFQKLRAELMVKFKAMWA